MSREYRDFPLRTLGHRIFAWPDNPVEGQMIRCYNRFGDKDVNVFWNVDIVEAPRFGSYCPNCGEHMNFYHLNEDGFVGPMEPCRFPGAPTVNEFTVKSGRLIIDDDLRDVFKDSNDERDEFATYNSKLGQKQVIDYMNAQGCVYGPVGNSSPTLFRTGEGTYVIANPAFDEENDDFEKVPGWEALGWFCTDLWAYSMADYDDYIALGGRPIEELDAEGNWTRKVIEFPNGRYRITHHTTEAGWTDDFEGGTLYASIEKID